MSSLRLLFTVILLTLFPDAHAQNDTCPSYKNVSDPWRNVGFCSNSCNRSDINLTPGWYRFTGVGGDQVVTSCGRSQNTSNQNVSVYNLFTCNSTINYTDYITCSSGLTVYYLRATHYTYATRHSACTNSSSCGPNAECGTVYGSCMCNPGLFPNLSDGINSYGCSVLTVPSGCQTTDCAQDFLSNINQILNTLDKPMPKETVGFYLGTIMNTTMAIGMKNTSDDKALVDYANDVLAVSEKLVSSLVVPTNTESQARIQLDQMVAEVFTVGPNTTLSKIPKINSSRCSLNIDLIDISKKNNGSASVIFISYSNMATILKASFFTTNTSTVKTIISPVVSATLPNTTPTSLDTAVNFTFSHQFTDSRNLSCVYWNETEWIIDGCMVTAFNGTFTVCSCLHLSTFALIMQTDPDNFNENNDTFKKLFNIVVVSVGLFFLFLTICTLTFCQRGNKVTNAALINLCLSLFLGHITFLLTQENLDAVTTNHTMCMVLAGIIHFLFLSAFVWMLIEAILLYICVKNLSKISSMQSEALNWKYMIAIGYIIPLSVVGVTSGLYPGSYSDKQCWLRNDFIWTFLGPVSCIIAINLLLSLVILVHLKQSLANLNKSVSHLKHTRTLVLKSLLQFVILGGPWVLGYFVNNNDMIEIIFIFFNSQQGTFIFIVHCVLNEEIRQQYKNGWNAVCQYSKYKSMGQDQTNISRSHSNKFK